MKFGDAATLIAALPAEQAVLLLGPPGSAKSSLARAVGVSMGEGAVIECRELASHLAEDLLGLPFREDGTTKHAPPAWLHRLSVPETRGVLILDDLAAASPAVQTAAFKLVLERRSGDCALAEGVRIIATANRREDRSGATVLPAALRNRCLILQLDVDAEEWCAWATGARIHEDVIAYIRFRPAHLSKLPTDADKAGAFATPRSWHFVSRALESAMRADQVLEVVSGLVSDSVATDFVAFVRLRQELPDPIAVLEAPELALPTIPEEIDRRTAIVLALGERAAKWKNRNAPTLLLRALGYVCRDSRELLAVGIQSAVGSGMSVERLVAAAREKRGDSLVAGVLRFLQATAL
jgi:MoxR-like ATPase